jgi:hypothetical protein
LPCDPGVLCVSFDAVSYAVKNTVKLSETVTILKSIIELRKEMEG